MNTPNDPVDPRLWAQRQAHAASLLRTGFAERVLRGSRQTAGAPTAGHSRTWRFFHNPFALSALTACTCLIVAIVYHSQFNRLENERNLADWRDITAQVASLDPL